MAFRNTRIFAQILLLGLSTSWFGQTEAAPTEACPKGAEWSSCSGCGSHCPVKGMACTTECKDGCVCEQPGYVIHDGACIPRENCPDTEIKVTCPPNQIYGCMRLCFSNCDNLNSTYEACPMVCKLGCDCLDGFVFQSKDSKVCVPVSECKVSCPKGMEFRPCYRFPLQTCDTLGITSVPSLNCRPRCVCKEGYVLSNDPKPHCVKTTMCPKYPKPVPGIPEPKPVPGIPVPKPVPGIPVPGIPTLSPI